MPYRGYFLPAADNGGFADAEAKTGWKVSTWDKINAAGKKTGPSNFDTAPAEIKNIGNVQCENCHGPANEHVKNGADVMAVSFRNDTCNACHAGGGTHIKGLDIENSKHFSGWSFEEVNGPGIIVPVKPMSHHEIASKSNSTAIPPENLRAIMPQKETTALLAQSSSFERSNKINLALRVRSRALSS